jgi:pimeloyl-ACP methyl ester carboxylesterase
MPHNYLEKMQVIATLQRRIYFPVKQIYDSDEKDKVFSMKKNWIAALLGLLVASGWTLNAQLLPTGLEILKTEDQIKLAWEGTPEAAFTLQMTERLRDNIWVNAPGSTAWPTRDRQWTSPFDPASSSQKFYRLVQVEPSNRGALLSLTPDATYYKIVLQLIVGQLAPDMDVTFRYGVETYKVSYETITPRGDRTLATGLICLPSNCPNPIGVVSLQHGTIVVKTDAPSYSTSSPEALVSVAFAGMGYVSVVTDYLGLGGSPGFHPFCHAGSEATAAIDLLRTTKQVCSDKEIVPSDRLFLIGYSQGGHATMALQREIESRYADEFNIIASAPMAGPYDLSGTMADDFQKPDPITPLGYFAYIMSSYQQVYRLVDSDSVDSFLLPPYNEILPPLMDGTHSADEIDAVLPERLDQVMRPEYLAAVKNDPNHPLRVALRDNDTCKGWLPKAPMRLWHCSGDHDVLYQNSLVAVEEFRKMGLEVTLTDPVPGGDHGDGVLPSLIQAFQWFMTFEPVGLAAETDLIWTN